MEMSVLLIDDDADCRLVMRDAIQSSKTVGEVYEVSTGEDALDFLRRQPPFEGMPRPGLIYLDINLPGLNGLEVLKAMKEDAKIRDIPVVVITAYDSDRDKTAAALQGANSYCLKPADPASFIQTVIKATDYWVNVHKSPSANRQD